MNVQKFNAKKVFNGSLFLPGNKVIIINEKGIIEAIVPIEDAGDDVQELDGILSPGFINCHCHLELSHMKGLIAEKTGLVDFVFSIVTQRHFPEDEILEAIKDAEEEMIANGIVAVGDICNNPLTAYQKQQHHLHYYNFVETSGWLPDMAGARFERSKIAFDIFSRIGNSALVPHAPYSVSENLWQLIQPYYAGKVVSIHNQETNFEDEFFIQHSGDFVRMYELLNMDTSFYKPSGKSSLQTYFSKLKQAAEVMLVHNTFTTEQDLDFIRQQQANPWFCLCANANLYIENALPPIHMLRSNQCKIVLGTDSLASNHRLSILDEMKTIQQHFADISLQEMLGWATLNGAKALQMDNTLGSLEAGKKPGLILIENVENDQLAKGTTVRRLV